VLESAPTAVSPGQAISTKTGQTREVTNCLTRSDHTSEALQRRARHEGMPTRRERSVRKRLFHRVSLFHFWSDRVSRSRHCLPRMLGDTGPRTKSPSSTRSSGAVSPIWPVSPIITVGHWGAFSPLFLTRKRKRSERTRVSFACLFGMLGVPPS